MKRWLKVVISSVILCVVAIIVAVIIGYFNFINRQVQYDSERQLKEIYTQVNNSFSNFMNQNQGILNSLEDHFELTNDLEENQRDTDRYEFIQEKKEFWGFSRFYFINQNKDFMTSDKEMGTLKLNDSWEDTLKNKESIMVGEVVDHVSRTIFITPVPTSKFNGFEFQAIAVGYTNTAIAHSLNANAFGGSANCFVVDSEGTVLFSTGEGNGSFQNYLMYIKNYNLDDETIEKITNDLKNFKEGFLQCEINKEKHCIIYMPVKTGNYSIISDIPQTVVSEGFLLAQRATMRMLLIIFSIIIVTILSLIAIRIFNQSRKNRKELQYREKMIDVLSNTVNDILLMLDPQTQVVDYISPNINRLLGIPVKEARENIRGLVKCAVDYNIVVPEDELKNIPLNGNINWECEYMHQTTGERRWYRVTIYRLNIQSMEKYIVVMSDRTLDRQLNLKLQEALNTAKSANDAKSNFLSNMSHDIRTPMNAIVGFSVLLEKNSSDPEKVQEYTRKIMASSHHLLSLINDVLDMSKIESGKTSLNLNRMNISDLVEDLNIIIAPQANAKNQTFIVDNQVKSKDWIMVDRLRLNQILINLLSNAVKYTPENGEIDFLIQEIPTSKPKYLKLQFIVQDNGIGMSEEFQQKIFLPFTREINSVTNKVQGTGLGMAITKNLIDLMGGIIQVESALGKGSKFTLEMSFAIADLEDPENWFHDKIKNMLIADDEIEICQSIEEMVRPTGIHVQYVTEGAKAVEETIRAQKRGVDYDLILLDWKMPGMDGVETARQIREKVGEDLPILVLTSYDWSEIEAEAKQAGINAFMPKPFFLTTFFQTVKPLFNDNGQPLQKKEEYVEGSLKGMLFLVAEDNELNAEILTEMLRMEGIECDVASNGEEAVQFYEREEAGHYDLILMDVQMPKMNGYEATKMIRSSSHSDSQTIPIVAMTANTFAEDVQNALDAGMDGHLAKPIDMKAVRRTLQKLLKRSK